MILYEPWKKYLSTLFIIIIMDILILPVTTFAKEILTIGGTGSAMAHMKILGRAFEKSHPDIKIKVIPSLGSTGGIKAVSQKSIDIAISSKVLNDKERKFGLSVIEYAITPLIFIVNPSVLITTVTSDDIVDIYNGKRTTWSDGQRIRVPMRQRNEIDILIVRKISPEISRAIDVAFSRRGMLEALTDQDNAAMIENTRGSFGISTLTQVIAENRQVKVLSYNGIKPSIQNIIYGSYPLVRHFFTVTQKNLPASTLSFLEFIRSKQGKKILEATGNAVVTR